MSDRPLSTATYEPFLDSFRSLILATVNAGGLPEASYAPYVRDEDKNFYLLASELATHTANLMTSTQASVLFIEDEDKSQQIFGRRRLSFSCQVKEVNRNDRQWTTIIDRMRLAHGERVAEIATLEDFYLFKLIPQQGRFVQGFGKIYEIGGQGMGEVTPFQAQRLN